MKIAEINSVHNLTFNRKPNSEEMRVYTSSLNEGLKLLNKRMDIIIHNASAPSEPQYNIGIGSLFSKTVQKKLIPFLKAHCFSGIQQEPNNLRMLKDNSPYAPESSAKNVFMIPLEKLTTEKYGQILPQDIFKSFVIDNRYSDHVDYDNVRKTYNTALKIAYKNFKENDILKSEFEKFKKENVKDLEKVAIYRVLSHKYQKPWTEWPDVDINLFSPVTINDEKISNIRINDLKHLYKDEIDYFMFKQFLVDIENKESNKYTESTGIKIIGDSPVATPAAEEWINQNLFLKNKAIGCPPDYFSKDGQRWGFKYFNPKYIFNSDGTLGKAGKILKEKYDKFFESFPGGLRIDHVIGLVDPFIYTENSLKMTPENSGRIYSIKGEFKKKRKEYSNILEKIILQSAKEHNISKSDIICEDLGDVNKPTQMVMKKLDLPGIAVTQFDYRGAEVPEKNVIMIGSHDNESFLEYTEKFFDKVKNKNVNQCSFWVKLNNYLKKHIFKYENTDEDLVHFMKKTKLLAIDTVPKNATKKETCIYKQELRTNKNKFMEASFAELFTSPARRIQIFFADFWGLGKTYNRPGTEVGNWELRIPSNFEQYYYDAVSKGKAPNLAKAVLTALRHRGLDKTHPELISNLENSARILSEQ